VADVAVVGGTETAERSCRASSRTSTSCIGVSASRSAAARALERLIEAEVLIERVRRGRDVRMPGEKAAPFRETTRLHFAENGSRRG